MIDEFILYISAAPDLGHERDLIGRIIAEIPVSLGWQILQTPLRSGPVDIENLSQAHIHLLLLGSDIRAPVGYEWLVAKRFNRWTTFYLKDAILRTAAAQDFIRKVEEQNTWQVYKTSQELRMKVQILIGEHILESADWYGIKGSEKAAFQAWLEQARKSPETGMGESPGGAGESGVILSVERYIPKEGVLLQPPQADPPSEPDQ